MRTPILVPPPPTPPHPPTTPAAPVRPKARARVLNVSVEPHVSILNAFLIFLYCLHVYW